MAEQKQLKLGNKDLHYNAVGERLLARSNLPLVLAALDKVYGHAQQQGAGTSIASHYDASLLELGSGRVPLGSGRDPAGDLEQALLAILTYDKVTGDNIDGALIMDGTGYRNRMHLFDTNWSQYFRGERGIEGEITPEKLHLSRQQLGTRHITAIAASAAYAKAHPDSYVLVLSSSGTVRAFQDGYAVLSPHAEELARPQTARILSLTARRGWHGPAQTPPPVSGAVQPTYDAIQLA